MKTAEGIKLDITDLFPLFAEGLYSYQDEQRHSAQVDHALGLDIERVEAALVLRKSQFEDLAGEGRFWLGLGAQALLTPYTEIRRILSLLTFDRASRIVDLGAGYGRMGFVIGQHYKLVQFEGYEVVSARIAEGQRCLGPLNYDNVRLIEADVSAPNFVMPKAEFYFIYDFGSRVAISKALGDLKDVAHKQKIQVIGRGRATRDCIERENPWLSQVQAPEHFRNFSIYRS